MYKAPGAGGAIGAGTAGTLAYTGVNVTSWIVLGAVLIVLGVMALFATRLRRQRLSKHDAKHDDND